jgi:hypothetical protein
MSFTAINFVLKPGDFIPECFGRLMKFSISLVLYETDIKKLLQGLKGA